MTQQADPPPPTRHRLLTLSELPAWMRDNDYLQTSYRPHLPSIRACFYSAFFALTNETINVWSHTLGFFLFLLVALRILTGPTTAVSSNIFHIPSPPPCVSDAATPAICKLRAASAAFVQSSADAAKASAAFMQSRTDAAKATIDTASAAMIEASAAANEAKHHLLSMAATLRTSALPNSLETACAAMIEASAAGSAAANDAKQRILSMAATLRTSALPNSLETACAAMIEASAAGSAAANDAKQRILSMAATLRTSALPNSLETACAAMIEASALGSAAANDAKQRILSLAATLRSSALPHSLDTACSAMIEASAAGSAAANDAKQRILSMAATLRTSGLPNSYFPIHVSRHDLEKALAHVLAEHKLGMAPLLAAACFCMAASATYHAFWVYSPRALHTLGKVDFLGISLLCCGHGLSGIFYAFYCRPMVATWYYVAMAIAETLVICAIFSPGFSSPSARRARTLVFSALGASSVFPLVHAGILHGWANHEFHVVLSWALAALSVYGVGALLYVSRYPECCRVGKHDRFFASHQLMHIAVMVGVALHLNGCYKMLDYRLQHGCSVSPLLT